MGLSDFKAKKEAREEAARRAKLNLESDEAIVTWTKRSEDKERRTTGAEAPKINVVEGGVAGEKRG